MSTVGNSIRPTASLTTRPIRRNPEVVSLNTQLHYSMKANCAERTRTYTVVVARSLRVIVGALVSLLCH
jgi:hypothetical protein